MQYYETVFIARQDLTEAQVKDLTEQFTKIIEKFKGKIHKVEQWGLRNFAYRINKARKGHYTLIESQASGEAIQEMERVMRLNEDVVRYLTIRLEELSNGPSVVMDKSGRYDDDSNNDDSEKEAA